MFWIVQENIYNEHGHNDILEALEKKDIKHAEVKVVPFFDKLLPAYFDSHNYEGSVDDIDEEFIDESGHIMVLGSISLANIAKERGWHPGNFLNENFHYNNWKKNFGEHLLNYDSQMGLFHSIEPKWDTFFIRPCKDTKDFDGAVFTKEEFTKWRNKELSNSGVCEFENSEVVISPTKHIYAEYRFFVVDGKLITGSQYKKDFKLHPSSDIDSTVLEFAQNMIDLWHPARAFVIDIAKTDNGLKVIEINNFNSAGFYQSDVSKIIDAIEGMTF